jgi:hypothetical protein
VLYPSGWVLADLNGDQQIDLASASSGLSDAGMPGSSRHAGRFPRNIFPFPEPRATVELSSRDVDGDHDGDLIV